VRQQDRPWLFGNAQPVDEGLVADLKLIHSAYPKAFSPSIDIADLANEHGTYRASSMFTCTLAKVYQDASATMMALNQSLSLKVAAAVKDLQKNADAGNPDAVASIALITAKAEKRKADSKASQKKTDAAFAEGQADREQIAANYEEALLIIAQQQQRMAAMAHEITVLRSSSPATATNTRNTPR
jgi:hypothetical protein